MPEIQLNSPGHFNKIVGPNLQNILRQSYDNSKVTIDLRRTSNLQNISQRMLGFSWVGSTCKIVRLSENSVLKLHSILLAEILARFIDCPIVSRSYNKLKTILQ